MRDVSAGAGWGDSASDAHFPATAGRTTNVSRPQLLVGSFVTYVAYITGYNCKVNSFSKFSAIGLWCLQVLELAPGSIGATGSSSASADGARNLPLDASQAGRAILLRASQHIDQGRVETTVRGDQWRERRQQGRS